VVFSVGSEATLFMAGIVEGGSFFERLEHPDFWARVQAGEHNGPLNAFLAEAAERVRGVFHGPLTYASVPLETVDWSRFDFVSADLYRDARIKNRFAAAFSRFGQSTGCQRWNVAPWSSTHSASSPYGLRSGSSARPPAARTRSTAAAMSSTR
jgi:hypothetical protein